MNKNINAHNVPIKSITSDDELKTALLKAYRFARGLDIETGIFYNVEKGNFEMVSGIHLEEAKSKKDKDLIMLRKV